jgi:hypothetical protein
MIPAKKATHGHALYFFGTGELFATRSSSARTVHSLDIRYSFEQRSHSALARYKLLEPLRVFSPMQGSFSIVLCVTLQPSVFGTDNSPVVAIMDHVPITTSSTPHTQHRAKYATFPSPPQKEVVSWSVNCKSTRVSEIHSLRRYLHGCGAVWSRIN